MVHLRRTSVSGSPSHFETPGIHSARLESAAEPNEILCTPTVFDIFSPHYSDMFPGKALDVQTKDRLLKAYIVCPRPLPTVRVIVSDLLFADKERLGKLLHGTKKILIVDDEPMITEVLPELLQLYIDKNRIVVANDGEEALRLFSPGNYMAVLTDIVMPNMDGIDLSRSISTIDPDVPVVMMSGYSMGDRYTSLFDAGAVLAFTKPITSESVLRSLAFAVAFGTPSILRKRLQILTDKPSDFLRWIERIADVVHYIIRSANNPEDVGDGLLRHKAKHIATEAIRRLVPGGDVVPFLESAASQLNKIENLCLVSQPKEKLVLEKHLQNMINDYSKANKKSEITIDCDLPASEDLKTLQSVALLIVFELIDNALDATDHKGKIWVEVDWVRSRQQLRITVSDDGPGVPIDMVDDLFQMMRTTKERGRGMGLHLVKQACDTLRGSIHYSKDEKTHFIALLRLPMQFHETISEHDTSANARTSRG